MYIQLWSVCIYCPCGRNCTIAGISPCCCSIFHESPRTTNILHPITCICIRRSGSECSLYVVKTSAAIEHIIIAAACQCCGRQFWGCCQTSAIVEHITIAIALQRCGRQFWGCCQTCAAIEHIKIAAACQRCGRKFWCGSE